MACFALFLSRSGLAGLTAAFYLVRDGQMKGEHIHLLEKLELAGGSCDGRKDVTKGFFMRGGREMDNHFEVMWDMFRDVPSLEKPGVSVLDEYYWLNKHDPNYSLCRATVNCGDDAHTDKKFNLDKESAMALSKLFITPEKDLEGKKISDVLPDSFWETNFWLYWQTMFAFQRWSSALEMKRYLCRYVHHIDGLPDFSALRFTKLNQYESLIMPLVKYLESHGVQIEYGMDVKNVVIETVGDKKIAKQIIVVLIVRVDHDMVMVVIMLPFIFFALYEKDGQPAEKILGHVVKTMFLRDRVRPYRTENLYAVIQREIKEKEELQIEQCSQKSGKAEKGAERRQGVRRHSFR